MLTPRCGFGTRRKIDPVTRPGETTRFCDLGGLKDSKSRLSKEPIISECAQAISGSRLASPEAKRKVISSAYMRSLKTTPARRSGPATLIAARLGCMWLDAETKPLPAASHGQQDYFFWGKRQPQF